MRLLIGLVVGFVAGAGYGVVFAVQVPDGRIAKAAGMIKLIWGLMQS